MCAMHGCDYIVVAGSTRPNRRSPSIAQWVATLGEEVVGAPFRVVDLRDLGLELDDEPGIPALHGYERETTRAWGKLVAEASGVVIVTPQYNWGYPAVLKNAIDHLYREWQGKPVLIVTYGGHGGNHCGEQLRIVMRAIGTRLTGATPGLLLAREKIVANDGEVDPARDFAVHTEEVKAALSELVTLVGESEATEK
jgi:NAD(P)H-dependent FMN reductase